MSTILSVTTEILMKHQSIALQAAISEQAVLRTSSVQNSGELLSSECVLVKFELCLVSCWGLKAD